MFKEYVRFVGMRDVCNLSVGLITHAKSKYLDFNNAHDEFEKLILELGINDRAIFISNKNRLNLDDIVLKKKTIIRGSWIYFKTLMLTQLNIISNSNYKISVRNWINLIEVYLVIFYLILDKFIFSLMKNRKNLSKDRTLRQSNITSGHISAMKELLHKNTKYILILEDDFKLNLEGDFNLLLKNVINEIEKTPETKIVNLSLSFREETLGITRLKKSIKEIKNTNESVQEFVVYKYPVANTMCATLYESGIVRQLIRELEKLDLFHFIPVDHKLNIAMKELVKKGELSLECYSSLNPGILVQRSLHG